jgi:hypothetical protein
MILRRRACALDREGILARFLVDVERKHGLDLSHHQPQCGGGAQFARDAIPEPPRHA